MEAELAYTGPVVVFDLDDTLYKELDFLKSGFRAVAQYVSALVGRNAGLLFEEMEAARSAGENAFDMLSREYMDSDEGFIGKAVELYRTHKPRITLSPGAATVLETLSNQGVRLGLITDGRSLSQRNKIEALGIARHFAPENILVSEETGAEKKAIMPWQTFVRRYPNARGFAYVGDNPAKDFRMPNMLGWLTVGLRDRAGMNIHPQNPADDKDAPDYWINELTELTGCLREKNLLRARD